MGRSHSRDRRRDKDKDKDKEKDKERKRSRSRKDKDKGKEKDKERKRSRSREKKEKKERKESRPEPEPAAPPPRQRSPSFQYRRWRFDSPPKEEEYQRDALLTGNAMGIGGIAAALQGGLALGGLNTASPLAVAADTKAMRELYVGNLPAGITAPQLVQFLNQVAQAVKVNSLPGEPVLGATMGGGGLFAFVEFRTAEEAANGLRLNGVELLGCQLKVGRPKGYAGPESAGGGQLALTGGAPGGLGDMMAQHGALGRPGMMALPGMGGPNAGVSAIDHRLCLINIPTFVTEDRIKELLITFGQLKFFALQKDEDGKSVGVAFFEYADMMTQQQARAALEGLELGAKKLSVKKPEEVIELGLVAKVQKLGHRVVPSKVIYLKNVVSAEELADDTGYQEICADIRLEAEKFGAVTAIEVPRPRGAAGEGSAGGPGGAQGALTNAGAKGPLALTNESSDGPKATPQAPAAPADLSTALVLHGSTSSKKAPVVVTTQSGPLPGAGGEMPGVGFAFIEFATIEGASKAKKALNGRRFGPNLVEAEYFSEDKFRLKDFTRPTPNTDLPTHDTGMELALVETGNNMLDEAPVMVE
mmetsp:Transcript_58255/g.157086  ORF Transcript_58255/g.157086 Transcript_58255/m.157086 type:complete len:588 (-) Transcript_58255:294-2057(-)